MRLDTTRLASRYTKKAVVLRVEQLQMDLSIVYFLPLFLLFPKHLSGKDS